MILTDIDRSVVETLRGEPRISYADLAKAVGISADAAAERVAQLCDSGVVTIAATLSPPARATRSFLVAGVKVSGRAGDVAHALAAEPAIPFVACTSGRYDIMIELATDDGPASIRLLDEHVRTRPGVASVETFAHVQTVKWLGAGAPKDTPSGVSEVDDSDRAIAAQLHSDGRMSYAAIAEGTGMSYASARRKTLRLLDHGMVRLEVAVAASAMAPRGYAIVLASVDGDPAPVADRLARHGEVAIALLIAGRFDISFAVVADDRNALHDFVGRVIRSDSAIRSTETLEYLEIIKISG